MVKIAPTKVDLLDEKVVGLYNYVIDEYKLSSSNFSFWRKVQTCLHEPFHRHFDIDHNEIRQFSKDFCDIIKTEFPYLNNGFKNKREVLVLDDLVFNFYFKLTDRHCVSIRMLYDFKNLLNTLFNSRRK